MAATSVPERKDELTERIGSPTVTDTVERQHGLIPNRRIPVSYQKGSIEKKSKGKFLLRYRIRDASKPGGWGRASVLLDATTEKDAEKERNRRMLEINQQNDVPPSPPPCEMTFM